MTGPSQEELARFLKDQALQEQLSRILADSPMPSWFAMDCDAVIAAQIENAECAKSNYLPVASLLRLARLIGCENVHYLEALCRPGGSTLYLVKLVIRNEVSRKRQRRYRMAEDELRLEVFGRHVLELEQQGLRRWEALHRAGDRVKFQGASRRYLEQKFREFEAISKARGYVRDQTIGISRPPRYGLANLKARIGRPRKVRM